MCFLSTLRLVPEKRGFCYFLALVSFSAASGCSNYMPLAVRTAQVDGTPIVEIAVKPKAVVEHAEYNVYSDSTTPNLFWLIPLTLRPLVLPGNSVAATALERSSGVHLILTMVIGPSKGILSQAKVDLIKLGYLDASVQFYPARNFAIRPLTDPLSTTDLRYTAFPAATADHPFRILLTTQTSSKQSVRDFKRLVGLTQGLLLEASFEIVVNDGTNRNSVTRKGLKLSVSDIEITNLSL